MRMDQIYFFRDISRLQCILSYFQKKPASFDRKKDFRNTFKEEQRSDNALNGWQKQDRRPHDRAEGPKVAHTAVRLIVRRPRCAVSRRLELLNAISILIFGKGLLWDSFEDQLGLD